MITWHPRPRLVLENLDDEDGSPRLEIRQREDGKLEQRKNGTGAFKVLTRADVEGYLLQAGYVAQFILKVIGLEQLKAKQANEKGADS